MFSGPVPSILAKLHLDDVLEVLLVVGLKLIFFTKIRMIDYKWLKYLIFYLWEKKKKKETMYRSFKNFDFKT